MDIAAVNKASTLLQDLAKLDNLKNEVKVDQKVIKLELDFLNSKSAQEVAAVIAKAINGSQDMNKVRRSLKNEIRQLLRDNI